MKGGAGKGLQIPPARSLLGHGGILFSPTIAVPGLPTRSRRQKDDKRGHPKIEDEWVRKRDVPGLEVDGWTGKHGYEKGRVVTKEKKIWRILDYY